MDVSYRDAKEEDCKVIAQYIYYASDGILDILLGDVLGDMTVPQILENGLCDKNRHDSYENVIVAEILNNVIGMIQTYPAKYHKIDNEMESFLSRKKLEMFRDFYELRIDNSLLINAMFVDKEFRRNKIGTKFISLAKEKATSLALKSLSLFVLDDNLSAKEFYYSNGFQVANTVNLKTSAKDGSQHAILLMNCYI